MSEWKENRLGDVITHFKGYAFKSSQYSTKGVPIVKVTNLTNNSIDLSSCVCIKEKDLDSNINVTLLEGDVIITTVGSWPNNPNSIVGKVVKVPKASSGALLNQNAVCIRAKEIMSQSFLYYVLRNEEFKNYIISGAQGSANQASITLKNMFDYKFTSPNKKEQKSISEILSSLDDKIELNNKINQELESLAQLLFKRWFVDFEFPNENGEPYNSSGGKMEDSELGEIPKGWNILSLESATTEITRGFTTSYVEKSNLINLNQKVNRGSFLDKSNFKYYSDETIVPNNKYAKKQDILINSLGQGTLGRIHFYLEDTNNVVVDQHITIVRANNFKVLPEILYLTLTLDTNIERMSNMVTGSTGMLMLNISKIREFKVIAPPIKIQSEIAKVVYSLYEKINLNLQENEGLSKMRDCLIPKLISGELQINDN